MKEKNNEIFKIIFMGISIVVLIIFMVFAENIKKNNENQDIENNIINSNSYISNDIDKNNIDKIPGYNNLYQYEIDLETY